MKRLKHNFKKGMAFVLSLAMVAGLVPAMSGGANKVQAAPGSGTEPSVSAYATKTQLMDDTFAPKEDGTAVNYGKLVFGKKSDGRTAQEWYILGKDEGVSEDNTIIFAASPIATGQKFNSSTSNKTYNYEAGTGYEESAGSIEVYPNHYGASDLRVALQGMATNPNYFTTAEQGLMNPTTVTTKDTRNKDSSDNYLTYTTTDKLYALQGNYNGNKLWAGTSDSTVLAMNSYWSNVSKFWLRSPYDDYDDLALLADPGFCANRGIVGAGIAVQPASNLNLSSVLFASAATATSSDTVKSDTIESGTAMTLRFDGTGKNIGTVTYNTTTGDIKATKGSTSQTVALIVQGKNGTNDWYYSKQITGTETVNVTDIVSETNTPIDLSACKIWLEITDTDGLIYAVNATEDTSTSTDTMLIYVKTPDGNFIMFKIAKTATISAVKEEVFNKKNISVDEQQLLFNGEVLEDDKTLQDYSIGKYSTLQLKYVVKNVNATINTPKGGQVLDTNVTCAMNEIKSATLNWTDTGNNPVSGNANYYPWCYKAHVTLLPNDGYAVTDATEVYINNNATEEKTINTDGSITVTICFNSNQDKLTGITAPSPITTGNGAAKTEEGLGLPSQVDITTVEGAASKADVDWDLENLASGTYNPSILTEQIFTVNGTVTLPEEVGNTDNISLNITIQVTVSAAGIDGAPTANPTAGIYTENQSVTLTSSTEGATIYYTTDGSEPAITGGVPDGTTAKYTAPIAVTGTEGQSITTTIKAITVKNGIQDSSVETFTYTIQIPVPKYTVTVTNGSGTGQYAQGETVTITAGAAPSGQQFKEWEVVSGTITLASSTSETTTFTMPAEAVSVKANYEAIPMTAPSITTQPGNATVKVGETATFTIAASGDNLTYQWQIDRNDGNGWVNIAGANEASYTTSTVNISCSGFKYKCVVSNSAGNVESNSATLTVQDAGGSDNPETKDKLTSITVPQAITVANGTAYDAMNLPATVNIVTEGNTVSSASVTWNTTTPASGSYDPAVLTQQTVTLNGTVDCPDSIDANGVSLTTTITITISAAGIVGAPTANPTAGTYSENQSVALTSSTEGATIYYTTDGSEPTITGGVPGGTTAEYTALIAVTGTEGQSITTTIKAIAVKNGMQDSSVETFTYTIKIPVPKYTVTVTNGSGTGQYAQGETVTITAGAAPSGQQFKEWEVVSGTITLASSTSETTTFTMPAEAVSVKANYEAIPVTAPSITTQPGKATVKVGETATFTIAASGDNLTYQWQIDRNDGNGWVNIAGANEASYTTSTVNISYNGFKYQCVVSNSAGTVTSNTAVLTITENIIPDPDPVDYEILDGANSNWEQNSDGSLSIRGSGALSKFVGVKVDGTLVDAKNYTAKEGSTIITLKASYLNTLSAGTHTVEILWTDGSASTTFTIKANTSDNGNNNQNDNNNSDSSDDKPSSGTDKKDDVAKTGDNTPIVWLFILSILSGTGLIITVKKRRKNLKMSEK